VYLGTRWRAYGIAALFTGLALLISLLMQAMTGGRVMIMPFFPAVIAVALYAGVGPAVASALVTMIVAAVSWRGSAPVEPNDLWTLTMFTVSVALIIVIATRLRQAERRRTALLLLETKAREEAERVGRMKDEFLATLSHELRNPLSAIVGWAQVLHTQPLPPQVMRGLEIIERNARAQTRIIDELLDMSRIVAGTTRLEIRTVDLQKVIDSSITPVHPAANAKRIAIEKVGAGGAGVFACDPNRIQQVLWNLLSNAVKFTPEGGKVEVIVAAASHHAQIQIRDTGIGLAPEFLPFVFDRFRQADPSITRAHAGLGLGLSICKHLVELHGGTIRADSEGLGKGATFTIRLPLTAPPASDAPVLSADANEPVAPS
jgi:signal transduction histidine kinase